VAGEVAKGFLILLGVEQGDDETEARVLADKIAGLRVFTDENDKMNLSLADIDGEVLVISNFTLCADCSHGRRPSFIRAARPETAEPLYEFFCERLLQNGVRRVEMGVFGAGEVYGQSVIRLHLHPWSVGIEPLNVLHALGGGGDAGLAHMVADYTDDEPVEERQRPAHDGVVARGEGVECSYEDACSHSVDILLVEE
jgi:D-tyrosyl-tRNA(Tyr) deacylase